MNEESSRGIQASNKENVADSYLSDMKLDLSSLDLESHSDKTFRLPYDQIPALGVAFASLPETFRTVALNSPAQTLFSVTDAAGSPIDPAMLQSFHDGTGLLGSFRDAEKGFGQARLHVSTASGSSISTLPYDPTTLFMAMALAQINKKLDTLQETQEEMFEYMRDKDRAALRGNIQTLTDFLNNYSLNWDNDTWRNNAHMKVVDIKQESDKAIIHLRSQITNKLDKKAPLEVRLGIDKRLDSVLDRLKEYQIAVYGYAFASFLEPMLSRNFEPESLSAVAAQISEHSIRYRELYTVCYNAIDKSAKNAVDSMFLGGLSAAGKSLGGVLAATPIGEHSPVDEALIGAGEGVGRFNDEQSANLVEKIRRASEPNTVPFQESLETINTLYNSPMNLLADAESVYLIPAQKNRENN